MIPANRQRGRKARTVGSGFEEVLQTHFFAPLLRDGLLVRIDRLSPSAVPVGKKGGAPIWKMSEQSGADWIGLLRGGRYLAAEAKSIEGDRFPRARIEDKQIAHLDEAGAHAVALLLLEFRGPAAPRWYAVPWTQAPWKVARTAESLYAADLASWQIGHWTDLKTLLEAR